MLVQVWTTAERRECSWSVHVYTSDNTRRAQRSDTLGLLVPDGLKPKITQKKN